MIYYFSGTGNTKYVADMLADLLEDQAQNMVELEGVELGKERKDYDFSAVKVHSNKPVIVMSPVYVASPARVMLRFVKQATFSGNKNIYFVLTCAGAMSGSYEYCVQAIKGKGLNYMGTTAFKMPQNYLPYFTTEEREKGEIRIQEAMHGIKKLAEQIKNNQPVSTRKGIGLRKLGTDLVLLPYEKYFMKADAFHATKACISCGKCQKVCPLQNVHLMANGSQADGKEKKLPVWGKNCTHCMACISYCPTKAIEYGNKTKGKIRYTCRPYESFYPVEDYHQD